MQYFTKNHGEVDHVASYTEQERRFAVVTFKQTTDANEAAAAKTHSIDGYSVTVLMADEIVQPLQLLGINDDCLLEIMRHLELKDLCSAAGVCDRFNELAKMVFSAKWKDATWIVDSVDEAHDYLCNFGRITKSIRMKLTTELKKAGNCSNILDLMVKYCSHTITHLELHNFIFETNNTIIWQSRAIFVKLKKIILTKCSISIKWIVECHELIELELIDTHVTYNGPRHQSCSSLQSLKINGSSSWVQHGLHLFLQSNQQLKTLEILPLSTIKSGISWYERILHFVPPAIERLTIAPFGSANFERFVSLKAIRIVNKYFYAENTRFFIDHLETNAMVESLEIESNGYLSGRNANAIAKLRTLKTLKLHMPSGFYGASLLDVIEHQKHLTELTLSTFMSQLNGSDLLQLIQKCPNLQLLGLFFDFNEDDEKKLEMNADLYRKMLNVVSHRPKGNPLQIIIFSLEKQKNHINVTFPVHSSLRVMCLAAESVADALNIERGRNSVYGIRMTDAVLNGLRDRGLLEN